MAFWLDGQQPRYDRFDNFLIGRGRKHSTFDMIYKNIRIYHFKLVKSIEDIGGFFDPCPMRIVGRINTVFPLDLYPLQTIYPGV